MDFVKKKKNINCLFLFDFMQIWIRQQCNIKSMYNVIILLYFSKYLLILIILNQNGLLLIYNVFTIKYTYIYYKNYI